MGENTDAFVSRRADPINQDSKYRTLIETLIQLELNDWPKFQNNLKKLHSVEFQKAQTHRQVTNKEKSKIRKNTH